MSVFPARAISITACSAACPILGRPGEPFWSGAYERAIFRIVDRETCN